MIISGIHWFFATGIAVVIHLAGILWLGVAEPARQLEPREAVEGIVVTLGKGGPEREDTADSVQPERTRAVPDVEAPAFPEATAAVATAPPMTVGRPGPQSAETAPAPSAPARDRGELETVEVEPDTAAEAGPSAPSAVTPQTVETRHAADATAPAPDPAVDRPADSPQSPTPRVADANAPANAASVAAQTATDRPGESALVRFAEDVVVPEPPLTGAAVEETPTPDAQGPGDPAPEIQSASAQTAPAPVAAGNVAVVPPQPSGSLIQLDAVEARPAPDAASQVTAARQPAPEVMQGEVPETSQAAVPETVKLQELQAREGNGEGVVARYAGVLKGWLQKNMHYPRAARLAGQEGEAVVRFIIDREGRVQSVALESGSGVPLLDREATEMIERGNPFPAMPIEMPGQRLEVRVPVSFQVKDKTQTKQIPPIYLD